MHPVLAPLTAVLTALLLLGAPEPAHAGTDPVGVWPLHPQPDVVDRFDPPDQPWGAGHRGVDLAGSPGQPVRTALPGTVAFAGRIAGRGVVVVRHGDTRTTYEPVAAGEGLAVGDQVAAGDVVGSLELTGSHCFPQACLHWGWLRGSTYLDPLRLVAGGPVRLVPLAGLASTGLAPTALRLLGPRPALTLADVLAGRPAAAGRW